MVINSQVYAASSVPGLSVAAAGLTSSARRFCMSLCSIISTLFVAPWAWTAYQKIPEQDNNRHLSN